MFYTIRIPIFFLKRILLKHKLTQVIFEKLPHFYLELSNLRRNGNFSR